MVTLKLTDDELAIINDALQEMPYKMVAQLFNSINEQLIELKNKETK